MLHFGPKQRLSSTMGKGGGVGQRVLCNGCNRAQQLQVSNNQTPCLSAFDRTSQQHLAAKSP